MLADSEAKMAKVVGNTRPTGIGKWSS